MFNTYWPLSTIIQPTNQANNPNQPSANHPNMQLNSVQTRNVVPKITG